MEQKFNRIANNLTKLEILLRDCKTVTTWLGLSYLQLITTIFRIISTISGGNHLSWLNELKYKSFYTFRCFSRGIKIE